MGGCRREKSKEGERGLRESESGFGFSAGLGGRLVLAVGRSTALATTVQSTLWMSVSLLVRVLL